MKEAGETSAPEKQSTERLERVEERLVAHAETVQSGRVRVDRRVVTEPQQFDIELRRHEVDLERRPADRPLRDGEEPVAANDDETVFLVLEERLEVRKVPWVVEEIHVRRRVATETSRIEDTVRRERFEISSEGDVELKQSPDQSTGRDRVAASQTITNEERREP